MARSDRFNEAEAQEVRAQLDAQNLELRAQLEAENQELRAQLSACSEEVHMLNEHLEDYRHENDYLSQVCVLRLRFRCTRVQVYLA